ncbi:hypothetical protein D3C76_1379730 [compost metagenome]
MLQVSMQVCSGATCGECLQARTAITNTTKGDFILSVQFVLVVGEGKVQAGPGWAPSLVYLCPIRCFTVSLRALSNIMVNAPLPKCMSQQATTNGAVSPAIGISEKTGCSSSASAIAVSVTQVFSC